MAGPRASSPQPLLAPRSPHGRPSRSSALGNSPLLFSLLQAPHPCEHTQLPRAVSCPSLTWDRFQTHFLRKASQTELLAYCPGWLGFDPNKTATYLLLAPGTLPPPAPTLSSRLTCHVSFAVVLRILLCCLPHWIGPLKRPPDGGERT